jgi:hypothetical protein
MSSTIIYHETILRVPGAHAGSGEDLFIHLCHSGSSNCFEYGKNGRDGRRSRGWDVYAFGTRKQVLAEGIRGAGHLEGGCLKLGSASKYSKPETYIRRVKRLLKEAQSTNALENCYFAGRHLSVQVRYREETKAGINNGVTAYALHDSASFSTFYERFKADRGFEKGGFKYFVANGPEMR